MSRPLGIPRFVRALCLVPLLCACPTSSDPPGATPIPTDSSTATLLQVPFRAQQTQVWCWAATSEMVLAYSGNPITQCQIVSNWLALPCCSVPLQQCVVTAPSLSIIQQTLQFEGVPSAIVNGPLSFSDVRDQIDAGDPMIMAYAGTFGGHVVVLFGYDDSDPSNPQIAIHNPLYGSSLVPFGSSGFYSGSGTWIATIVTQVPGLLPPNETPASEFPWVSGEDLQAFEDPELEDCGILRAHLEQADRAAVPDGSRVGAR